MNKPLYKLLGLWLAVILTAASPATLPPRIYAQQLVAETMKADAGLKDVIFHVTPPKAKKNIAIASYTAHELGRPAGADDLGVISTGQPLVEVQKDGVRIGVIIQLYDQKAHTIGALGLMYVYRKGDDPQLYLHRAEQTRDQLAKRISSLSALCQPIKVAARQQPSVVRLQKWPVFSITRKAGHSSEYQALGADLRRFPFSGCFLFYATFWHATFCGAACHGGNLPKTGQLGYARQQASGPTAGGPDPADNPTSPAKVDLGRALFWDPVLSGGRDVSCASCHHPANGLDLAVGENRHGLGAAHHVRSPNTIPFGQRNTSTVLNIAFNGLTPPRVRWTQLRPPCSGTAKLLF